MTRNVVQHITSCTNPRAEYLRSLVGGATTNTTNKYVEQLLWLGVPKTNMCDTASPPMPPPNGGIETALPPPLSCVLPVQPNTQSLLVYSTYRSLLPVWSLLSSSGTEFFRPRPMAGTPATNDNNDSSTTKDSINSAPVHHSNKMHLFRANT